MAQVPSSGTQEYLWWSQGATDEAKAHNEGLSHKIQDARHVLEDLARLQKIQDPAEVVEMMARIYCPERLRRRYR